VRLIGKSKTYVIGKALFELAFRAILFLKSPSRNLFTIQPELVTHRLLTDLLIGRCFDISKMISFLIDFAS